MSIEFEIIPLWIQNLFMLCIIAIDILFFVYSIHKNNKKIFLLSISWLFIIVIFFNSPFWRFSKISISHDKVKLNYGILCLLKNKEIKKPITCTIESSTSLFPFKKTFFLNINGYKSMSVTSRNKARLDSICNYLVHFKSNGQ